MIVLVNEKEAYWKSDKKTRFNHIILKIKMMILYSEDIYFETLLELLKYFNSLKKIKGLCKCFNFYFLVLSKFLCLCNKLKHTKN